MQHHRARARSSDSVPLATRVDFGPDGILLVSESSEDDEAEADWLAGALLLPRDALMACRNRGPICPLTRQPLERNQVQDDQLPELQANT
jgi:hypothetical protein